MNRRTFTVSFAALGFGGSALAAAPTRFSVKVTGKGPDVILIPGLACSGEVWNETVARISRTHRTHVIQLAGFGGLPAGPNATGPLVGPVAAELAAYIEDQKLDRPALIGHSIGGFLGLQLAIAKPALLGRLMIVDSLPFYSLIFNPNATVAMAMQPAQQSRAQLLAQNAATFERTQTESAPNMSKSPEGQKAMLRWSLASDRAVVAQGMYDVMTMDARAGLPGVKTPVTVIYAYDPVMGPGSRLDGLYKGAYAGLPGVKFVRADGSYHFIMFDQPQVFAREVDAFLA